MKKLSVILLLFSPYVAFVQYNIVSEVSKSYYQNDPGISDRKSVFNIELLEPATEKTISLKTTFINTSADSTKISNNRSVDYVRGGIRAIANYIVEIQIFEQDVYKPFTPTADIDPTPELSDYTLLQSGQSFLDTIVIPSYQFSKKTIHGAKFPIGKYRIRVAFNTHDRFNTKFEFTEWLEFYIPANTK